MRNKSISVVMGTYNGQQWLEAQLNTILTQLSAEDEIIICDDCSTDRTVEIIENGQDGSIKLYQNKIRLGAWKNIIQAIDYAQNEIIVIADQDDLWLPGKIEMIQKELSVPGQDLVMHDAEVIDEEGKLLFSSYYKERHVRHGVLKNAIHNGYTGCFIACTQEFIQSVRPFPRGIPYDQWLGLHGEVRKKSFFVTTPFVQWRRHGSNVTSPFVSPPLPLFALFWRRSKTIISIIRILLILLWRYTKEWFKKLFL